MFRFNIPVTKVDEEKRLVYGLVTEEIVDQAGEILDYETSKAHFQEWSDGISKATGGASLGNLRLMHQPVIAGKLIDLSFDDVAKTISCVAKIVSDDVWKLVAEGCLTGFSMGGKYVKRWKDAAQKGVYRFTARPVEVSVVDNPCVQTATFEYVKSDGSTELRKFHTEENTVFTQEQIAARAAQLAKAAGTPDATDQFMDEALVQLEGEAEAQKAAAAPKGDGDGDEGKDGGEGDGDGDEGEDKAKKSAETTDAPATETADADAETRLSDAAKSLVQVWQAPDGKTFAKKADAAAHVLATPGEEPESEVEKALRRARGEAASDPDAARAELTQLAEELGKAAEIFQAAEAHVLPLAKGLYEVRSLASLLSDLQYIVTSSASEAKYEGDGSPVPGQLLASLKSLAQTLIAMTEEEVGEMIASIGTNYSDVMAGLDIVENAALAEVTKAGGVYMQKAGARNSKSDASKIQAMHDHSVDLGASCRADKAATPDGETDLEETDLVKGLRAEISKRDDDLQKAITGINSLGEEMAALREKVETIGKTAQPLPPLTEVPVTATMTRFGKSETISQEDIEKMSDDDRAELAIRLAQTRPTHVGGK